jgi:hypothetical protein
LNSGNKVLGRNPDVDKAFSRSKPLLKNFWIPDVVITTPGGYENSRMSRARRRDWQKGFRRRLSGGDVKVKLWKMQQLIAVVTDRRRNTYM